MNTIKTNAIANSIRVIRKSREIVITKSFDKAASRFGTDEYEALQQARRDNPSYRVVVKSSRSNKTDHFKGLTYDFMEKYIASHDNADERMAEFNDLRATSEEAKEFGIGSASYGEIKAWFFKSYPEIAAFQRRREELLSDAA